MSPLCHPIPAILSLPSRPHVSAAAFRRRPWLLRIKPSPRVMLWVKPFCSLVLPKWRNPACISGVRPRDGQDDLSQQDFLAAAAVGWEGRSAGGCRWMEMWFWHRLEEGHCLVWLLFPFVPPAFPLQSWVRGGQEVLEGGSSPPIPAPADAFQPSLSPGE